MCRICKEKDKSFLLWENVITRIKRPNQQTQEQNREEERCGEFEDDDRNDSI